MNTRTQSEVPTTPLELARQYLRLSPQFQLGRLPTESRHPKTTVLSHLATSDLRSAIELLREVELDALKSIAENESAVNELSSVIRSTLASGGRIFLCGCGATGRLSLSLETLWREEVMAMADKGLSPEIGELNSVVSFIAGGDYALVRSIENFEDHPEYGARQLRDLGFTENDLLISCTEGGETPFVIGATEEAASLSKIKPWFLFCNPTETLAETAERSKRVLENPRVRSLSLVTGPMALTGSTRLQASTVLMLATGAALFSVLRGRTPRSYIDEFVSCLRQAHFESLAPLIVRESQIYADSEACLHATRSYGITVITDTTERSPTFSLVPFENHFDSNPKPSWTYLCVPNAGSVQDAWRAILKRDLRPLDWPEFSVRFGRKIMDGFDFSPQCQLRRERIFGSGRQHVFTIDPKDDQIVLRLDGQEAHLARPENLLCEHLLLKCAMNISSTLVMGRLGRFKSNLMLFVRATNNKLVDRAIRFIRLLLEDEFAQTAHKVPSYNATCYALFETMADLDAGEAVVPKTFALLCSRTRNEIAECPMVTRRAR